MRMSRLIKTLWRGLTATRTQPCIVGLLSLAMCALVGCANAERLEIHHHDPRPAEVVFQVWTVDNEGKMKWVTFHRQVYTYPEGDEE